MTLGRICLLIRPQRCKRFWTLYWGAGQLKVCLKSAPTDADICIHTYTVSGKSGRLSPLFFLVILSALKYYYIALKSTGLLAPEPVWCSQLWLAEPAALQRYLKVMFYSQTPLCSTASHQDLKTLSQQDHQRQTALHTPL